MSSTKSLATLKVSSPVLLTAAPSAKSPTCRPHTSHVRQGANMMMLFLCGRVQSCNYHAKSHVWYAETYQIVWNHGHPFLSLSDHRGRNMFFRCSRNTIPPVWPRQPQTVSQTRRNISASSHVEVGRSDLAEFSMRYSFCLRCCRCRPLTFTILLKQKHAGNVSSEPRKRLPI